MPDSVDDLVRHAAAALDERRYVEAAAAFRLASILAPHRPTVWHNYGEALRGLAFDTPASVAYRRAIRLRPAYPKALTALAMIAAKQGLRRATLRLMGRAVVIDPGFAEAWSALAPVLHEERRTERAVTMLSRAVHLDPQAAAGWQRLAAGLGELQWNEAADRCSRRALMLAPERSAGYVSYAGLCVHDGRLDLALALNARARQIDPVSGDADSGDSAIWMLYGDFVRARALARRGVALQPDSSTANINMGLVESGRDGGRRSRLCNQRALQLHPTSDVARFNLSMVLLAQGRFREGWELYEARWRMRGTTPPAGAPLWDGSAPAGRTILVVAEQGHGDSLQFIRYAPLLAARGARVRLIVQPALKRLLSGMPGVLSVHGSDEEAPPCDLCVPLLSLPRLFGTTLDTVPNTVPYLTGSEADRAVWRARLDGERRFKVGLVWAGDAHKGHVSSNMTDRRRSMTLAALAPLAGVPGVAFYSLQKGAPAEQAKSPPPGMDIIDWMDAVNDFADTAAFIEQLDLVISVDTSVCHLAGAVGRPVWVLSRFDACWRWLGNREDNPWYPTLRVFGQEQPGEWTPVIARVAAALHELTDRNPADTLRLGDGRPDDADARFHLALTLLKAGDFAAGWDAYEWRWRTGRMPRPAVTCPQWNGEPLEGRSILLHAEQGHGDTLQFVRYAPLVAARGGRVVLAVQPALLRLMHGLPGVASVHSVSDPLPVTDFHCPLLSLPRAFGTRLTSIPAPVSYLRPDPADVARWRERLPADGRLRVGLMWSNDLWSNDLWSGDPRPGISRTHAVDHSRSLPLKALAPLCEVPGVVFVSLQKGPAATEIADAPPGMDLLDPMEAVEDFADTAAIMATLHLVITVDSSVAHLAGALALPVWVLSHADGCWRWLTGRDDSPWYPSLTLFRQNQPDAWAPVVERLRDELKDFAGLYGVPAVQAQEPARPAAGPTHTRLRLNDITVVCADTACPRASLLALRRTLEQCEPDETLFFTDAAVDEPGVRRVPIAPLNGTAAYSHFMVKELFRHIETPFVLVVQWDGFALDPARWSDDFLRYDYVGARWPHHNDGQTVGNGGFSLRSRRLLEALQDFSIARADVEDDAICRTYRRYLERVHGIVFAPPSVADRFSHEWSEPDRPTFGFHGVANFVRHLDPPALTSVFDALPDNVLINNPAITVMLDSLIAHRRLNEALALSGRIDKAVRQSGAPVGLKPSGVFSDAF